MSEEWYEPETSEYGWCETCQAHSRSHPGESGCWDCGGKLDEYDYGAMFNEFCRDQTPRCQQCTTPMQELSRRWGEESYYGIYEYIEYGCPLCGERIELKYDVPSELLPFMPPNEDDEYDDDLIVPSGCGLNSDGICTLSGSEFCDFECPVAIWAESEDGNETR